MTISSISSQYPRFASCSAYRWLLRFGNGVLAAIVAVILGVSSVQWLPAAEPERPEQSAADRIHALTPSLESYVANGMKAFDVPGVAIGMVAGDELVYSKGFGVRGKSGGQPVNAQTIFQIGSTTKAFLSTTMAIAVDRGKFHWDDRIVDLYPDFQLKDPWVTREFRVFDLLAQRSGLPSYANDMLGILGFDENAMIHSLRYVEPTSSFRSSFGYTNITHLIAGKIVAKAEGMTDWNAVLRKELLDRLGMKSSTYTAAAIKAAPNHAEGHRYAPDGSVEVPFDPFFPYLFGGAGDINSNVEEMAHWVRLQLDNGSFEGQHIVSPENLAVTRTPKVAVNDKMSYALGWIVALTPNGNVVWHNGGTPGFGAFVGLDLDRHIGVVILTNEGNVGFPDALGLWIFDRLLGNPPVDHIAKTLQRAKENFLHADKMFAKPVNARPSPPLAPLCGTFADASFGKAAVKQDGDALVLALQTGAEFKLESWDGEIFTARPVANGPFTPAVEGQGPRPSGFVQFQMDKDGKLNVLRLSFNDGQAYNFRHE
jgi:CubicO group peptidase (beta-lactamase class C family)